MNLALEKLQARLDAEGIDALLVTDPLNRKYLTGFTGTAGVALLTRDKGFFLTDFRYVEQAKNQVLGFEIIRHEAILWDRLAELIKEENISSVGFESLQVSYQNYRMLEEKLGVSLVPTEGWVEETRKVKTEAELNLLRKSMEIAEEAFQSILPLVKAGAKEVDLAIELEYQMKKKGAEGRSFDFIVASGKRSSMPHGVASAKVIEHGDFVTFDFGARYQGYCSDITRTVVVGSASEEQKKIYNIVLDAQLLGLELVRSGVTGKEVDQSVREFITTAGYGEYFGHGLGHGVGLNIHEAPALNPSKEDMLEIGHVVTVEPGIYVPDWGGVRIEDMVIVEEKGCEVISRTTKELVIL